MQRNKPSAQVQQLGAPARCCQILQILSFKPLRVDFYKFQMFRNTKRVVYIKIIERRISIGLGFKQKTTLQTQQLGATANYCRIVKKNLFKPLHAGFNKCQMLLITKKLHTSGQIQLPNFSKTDKKILLPIYINLIYIFFYLYYLSQFSVFIPRL